MDGKHETRVKLIIGVQGDRLFSKVCSLECGTSQMSQHTFIKYSEGERIYAM